MSLAELNKKERLQLMKFVCSFAWADLEVQKKERDFVHVLVKKLKLNPEEAKQVEAWLKVPPLPEDVDPESIPREHRQLFVDVARSLIVADGLVSPDESENLELFQALLR